MPINKPVAKYTFSVFCTLSSRGPYVSFGIYGMRHFVGALVQEELRQWVVSELPTPIR